MRFTLSSAIEACEARHEVEQTTPAQPDNSFNRSGISSDVSSTRMLFGNSSRPVNSGVPRFPDWHASDSALFVSRYHIMNFARELAEWRAQADKDAAFYEARYPEGDFGIAFPSIARRWADALNRSELDPNEMRAIIGDAERYERGSGIRFYGFVNSMRATYRRLWEHFLRENTGEEHDLVKV